MRSSQTVAALVPKAAGDFDFTPGDLLSQRSQNGFNHLGDIDLRLRLANGKDWKNYSIAADRTPVIALPSSRNVLAAADLAPALPADSPLQLTRSWLVENGKLALRFELNNKSAEPVEVGADWHFDDIFGHAWNTATYVVQHPELGWLALGGI